MDPSQVLDRLLLELRVQLHIAQDQVCAAIADERALRRDIDRHADQSVQWERRAMRAIRDGDDAVARAALANKAEHDELTATYDAQWREQKRAVDHLRAALVALQQRIDEGEQRKRALVARLLRANAVHTRTAGIDELADDLDVPEEPLGNGPPRTEHDPEPRGARQREGHGGDAGLAALDGSRIEDELTALKLRMALHGDHPRRATPPS